MTESADQIKSGIERTRAELADTVEALTSKLDVKAAASEKVHEVGQRAAHAVEQVRSAAPEPVQHAADKVEHAARPVLAKAAADKRRTALIVGCVLLALIVLRRRRRHAAHGA